MKGKILGGGIIVTLQISDTTVNLYNGDKNSGNKWGMQTFLGDALEMLESEFSDNRFLRYSENADIIIDIGAPARVIWGMSETGRALLDLREFLSIYRNSKLSLADIEEYRLSKGITIDYLRKGDMLQYDCNSVRDVIFAILHFYAYKSYKVAQCKHCGKWFATKTLKEVYCPRISPCYNLVVAGKKVLSSPQPCEKAVRTITQKFGDRKKSIYNNWLVNFNGDLDSLSTHCKQYSAIIKEAPTVENIAAYQSYLYSDTMPKQERPNRRRSNALMRELIGR